MPPYRSYFETAQSAKQQWGLTDTEAKNVCELWELTELELAGTYQDKLRTEAKDFFKRQTTVDPSAKLKTVVKPINDGQFKKLIDVYRGTLVMRELSGGRLQSRADYAMIWQPMKGRMKGEANAGTLARLFNETYLQDEQVNSLQYLTGVKKNSWALKPYVLENPGKITVQVWHKS